MTKVIKIIENNCITGVQYGLVDVQDTPLPNTAKATENKKNITANAQPAPHHAPIIKQPGRAWQTKMSAAKKRIQDATRTKQK